MYTARIMSLAMFQLYTQAKEAILLFQVNLQLWMYTSRKRALQLLQRKRFIRMTAFYTCFNKMLSYVMFNLFQLCREEGHCHLLEHLLDGATRETTQILLRSLKLWNKLQFSKLLHLKLLQLHLNQSMQLQHCTQQMLATATVSVCNSDAYSVVLGGECLLLKVSTQ